MRSFVSTSRSLAMLAAVGALLASSVAMAQPKQGEGPPEEALTACKTAKANDSCSFTGTQGSVTGTCNGPEGRPLACVPAGSKAPGGASSTSK